MATGTRKKAQRRRRRKRTKAVLSVGLPALAAVVLAARQHQLSKSQASSQALIGQLNNSNEKLTQQLAALEQAHDNTSYGQKANTGRLIRLTNAMREMEASHNDRHDMLSNRVNFIASQRR